MIFPLSCFVNAMFCMANVMPPVVVVVVAAEATVEVLGLVNTLIMPPKSIFPCPSCY